MNKLYDNSKYLFSFLNGEQMTLSAGTLFSIISILKCKWKCFSSYRIVKNRNLNFPVLMGEYVSQTLLEIGYTDMLESWPTSFHIDICLPCDYHHIQNHQWYQIKTDIHRYHYWNALSSYTENIIHKRSDKNNHGVFIYKTIIKQKAHIIWIYWKF